MGISKHVKDGCVYQQEFSAKIERKMVMGKEHNANFSCTAACIERKILLCPPLPGKCVFTVTSVINSQGKAVKYICDAT